MNAAPPTDEEPSVVGLRVRPGATLALFALLAFSAGLGLYVNSRPGEAPVWVERGAPYLFLVFVVGFAAYRFALVAAHRYSAFKAFFQIFVAALFFMLLLPGSPITTRPAGSDSSLTGVLQDPNPLVRALAAEVAGYRHDVGAAPALIHLLEDHDDAVRGQARAALSRLNGGADLGPGAKEWKERFP